jgi:hypothetical protein
MSSTESWDPGFEPEELKEAMRAGHRRIIKFITSDPFKEIIHEMNSLPSEKRPDFVKDVLLNEKELNRRGVEVPNNLYIQRSSFGDRRPTLFVVKTFLPEKFHQYWNNVNITFDDTDVDVEIVHGEEAWQMPHHPELERLILSGRLSREMVDEYLEDPILEEMTKLTN